MDVSLITSLYRSASHLAEFLVQEETCIRALETRGYSADSVIICNAPDRREQRILDSTLRSPWWRDHSRLIVVPRETVYASWNRGMRASAGRAVGFWNVDDYRNPAAIIEGIELIRQGHALVHFPWLHVSEQRPWRSRAKRLVVFEDREKLRGLDAHSCFCLGPFFLVARDACELFGPFDEQFHIAGDYDWQLRAIAKSSLLLGEQLGGVFFVHGGNLSGASSPRLQVEQNVIFLRHHLDRPQWALDRDARRLFDSYSIELKPPSTRESTWAFERDWERSHAVARACRRGRVLAGALRRRLRFGNR